MKERFNLKEKKKKKKKERNRIWSFVKLKNVVGMVPDNWLVERFLMNILLLSRMNKKIEKKDLQNF